MGVVAHLCAKKGVPVIVYIDDLAGSALLKTEAQGQFKVVRKMLEFLGLKEAVHKASPPAQKMIWLGLQFNTVDMTVAIPEVKLREIHLLLSQWLSKSKAHKTQLQSLLGRLFHVAQCVRPARLFLNRMLATLRRCPQLGFVTLDQDFKKDIIWFVKHMRDTNGIYLLDQNFGDPIIIQVDSCETGAGALCQSRAYNYVYKQVLLREQLGICQLECLNALAAIRHWGHLFNKRHVCVQSDNAASVVVLQAGRGRDQVLQAVAREMWLLSVQFQCHVTFEHVSGVSLLPTADALSRMHTASSFKALVDILIQDRNVTLEFVSDDRFLLPVDW
jgi:hypothetical protein